jgi:glutaminyl-tRNA synthetase
MRRLVVSVVSVEKDAQGNVSVIKATGEELSDSNKPKAFIHWVCEPLPCEVRLYEPLLRDDQMEDDDDAGKDFLNTVNKDSLKVLPHFQC